MKRRSKKELKEEEALYKAKYENNKWVGFRICPECNNEIIHFAKERFVLLRTIRNSKNLHCASCNKSGKNNHFFGKKHSKESKEKQSINRIGKACGENNAMANPKNRLKVSMGIKARYDSGDLDFLKKIQSENAKRNQELGLLKYAPISKPEKQIKNTLEKLGFIVEHQFSIKSLHYDLFIKEKNLLIEYNGDYWHCNPKKYAPDYLNKKKNMKAKELWKQDENKKNIALKSGYNFLVIWESDYKKNKEFEINKILNTK
jgi:G:T-mismatch repair DNA endonuclease (very short patch repair protein)